MLKKRLIGVITVKNGIAVQSFGYEKYLPIGNPAIIASNLDRWGVDEIVVICIDRSVKSLGPDFTTLKNISQLPLSTPLTYGGGISTSEHAVKVIKLGAERIAIDAALHGDLSRIDKISSHVGKQAVVAIFPVNLSKRNISWYNYSDKTEKLLSKNILNVSKHNLFSEAMIVDWKHEGQRNGFNIELLKATEFKETPIIAFGGLSEIKQIKNVLELQNVVGVAIGNFLNYQEHSVQKYKEGISSMLLRPAHYINE